MPSFYYRKGSPQVTSAWKPTERMSLGSYSPFPLDSMSHYFTESVFTKNKKNFNLEKKAKIKLVSKSLADK